MRTAVRHFAGIAAIGYSANNELTAYGETTFEYDANGNIVSKFENGRITRFVYDVEDRLRWVIDNSGDVIAQYYYDPFGRRLWKEVDGVRTYFLYSDEGLVGEFDPAGSQLKSYGWRPDSAWGTDPLFLNENGVYYWYQNDHRGTPQKLIKSNGQVVWEALYDSFGNTLIGVEQVVNNLRLPGQYFDAETGLNYNWHRYYDPVTGRYTRIDPAGDGFNLYAYVFGSPMSYMDPYGLCAVHTALGLAEIIPGFGIIPDVLDTLLYMAEGDWANAALSGIAIISGWARSAAERSMPIKRQMRQK